MNPFKEATARNLQDYIEELLGTHQLLDCFEMTKNFSATIGISGARPLHIQRSASKITVAQYTHAGDEVLPDPEMIFRLNEDGQWLPTEAHFAKGAWSNCMEGSWLSNFRERVHMQALASRWLKELAPKKYECGEVLDLWGGKRMRVTVHVESDEATVLAIGFKKEPGFNYGYEVDLPISEVVAYTKARDEWDRVQERLTMIYRAKIKCRNKVLRRISKRFRKKNKEL